MTNEEIKKLTSEHRERNRELEAHFNANEVDLLVARPIEFHFWAWNQRDAAVLARGLFEMGSLIRVLAPAPTGDDSDRWTVEAGAMIPLRQALGAELTDKLIRLAGRDDAVFDGWDTNV